MTNTSFSNTMDWWPILVPLLSDDGFKYLLVEEYNKRENTAALWSTTSCFRATFPHTIEYVQKVSGNRIDLERNKFVIEINEFVYCVLGRMVKFDYKGSGLDSFKKARDNVNLLILYENAYEELKQVLDLPYFNFRSLTEQEVQDTVGDNFDPEYVCFEAEIVGATLV